jgi:hypothetical protein
MPSLSHNDWVQLEQLFGLELKFSEYNFKRLEYPFDTNCKVYENKTRAECLNECYVRKQIKSKNCIKNEEFLFTFDINSDGLEPDIQFCLNDENSKNNSYFGNQLKFCNKECPVSCEEQIILSELSTFRYDSNPQNERIVLNFYKNYYIDINYSPNMLFMAYIISVANLLSLWHGIDFLSIRDIFFRLFVKLLMKTKIKIIFIKIFQILMDYSYLNNFVVILLKPFKSMVKNLQVL